MKQHHGLLLVAIKGRDVVSRQFNLYYLSNLAAIKKREALEEKEAPAQTIRMTSLIQQFGVHNKPTATNEEHVIKKENQEKRNNCSMM